MRLRAVRALFSVAAFCVLAGSAFSRPITWSGCDLRQQTSNTNAQPSTGTVQRVADDFIAPISGTIRGMVWWGCFDGDIAETYTVRYYTDANNLPGQVIAEFTQPSGLTVSPAASTGARIGGAGLLVYINQAAHGPVAVTAGRKYWVEVTNEAADWFWVDSNAGNRLSVLSVSTSGPYVNPVYYTDRAWCMGIVSACAGDANGDGVVDFADLNAVLGAFGQALPAACGADVNGDGTVGFPDLNAVLSGFGAHC